MLGGLRVIVHRPAIVRRAWRERLFSLPWPMGAPGPVFRRAVLIDEGETPS